MITQKHPPEYFDNPSTGIKDGMPYEFQEGAVGCVPLFPCAICIKEHTWDAFHMWQAPDDDERGTPKILICINCMEQFCIEDIYEITPAEIVAAKLVLNI
jgi:hypothetical protein